MTPREAHDRREALIASFIEANALPPSAEWAIRAILEAHDDWFAALAETRRARKIAGSGS